jgi:hypothetical protein
MLISISVFSTTVLCCMAKASEANLSLVKQQTDCVHIVKVNWTTVQLGHSTAEISSGDLNIDVLTV